MHSENKMDHLGEERMLYLIILSILTSLNGYAQVKPIKELLLSLSDDELVKAAQNGKTGKCYIADAKDCSQCFCDFYAKTSKKGLSGEGLPNGYGSGCIVAPDSPRGVDICWGAPNVYDQYNSSKTPICGRSMVKNAANMIRIGIQRNLCDLPESPINAEENSCEQNIIKKDEEIRKVNDQLASLNIELNQLKKQHQDLRFRNEKAQAEIISSKKQTDEERKKKEKLQSDIENLKKKSLSSNIKIEKKSQQLLQAIRRR
jgi:hypothetical protein